MFGFNPRQRDQESIAHGMRKACYTCGHSEHFEKVVVWPPTKCQECRKGNLLTDHWCSQLDQKPAKI